MTFRVGVGGWTCEPWRWVFNPPGLPQRRELEYAAQQLTAIEINATFYGRQKPSSFANWAKTVPDGFKFSLKAPSYATARKVLAGGGWTACDRDGFAFSYRGPKFATPPPLRHSSNA